MEIEDKNRRRGIRRAYMNRLRKIANRKIKREIETDVHFGSHGWAGRPYNCYSTPSEIRDLHIRFKMNDCKPEKTWVHTCDCWCELKKGQCDHCKKISRWRAGELSLNDDYYEWLCE